jgi:prolipoprotein diacylglyceryltransferase
MRFFIESLRDGNPFEYAWPAIYKGTNISQNIGIYMVIVPLPLFIIFYKTAKKHKPLVARVAPKKYNVPFSSPKY